MKILENPENYFANLGGHLGEHLGEHNTKKGSKKCSADLDSLHIYNKNKDKNNNEINDLDYLAHNSIEKTTTNEQHKIYS